jgi:hypothetical protein
MSGCPEATVAHGTWRLTATEGVRHSPAGDAGAFYRDRTARISAAIAARSGAIDACIAAWEARWMMDLQPISGAIAGIETIECHDLPLWSFTLAVAPRRAMDRWRREDLAGGLVAILAGFG